MDNAQWGQRLIKVLDQPTQDGFVYRVDCGCLVKVARWC